MVLPQHCLGTAANWDTGALAQTYWIWGWGQAITCFNKPSPWANSSFGAIGLTKPPALWSNQSIDSVLGSADSTREKSWCWLESLMISHRKMKSSSCQKKHVWKDVKLVCGANTTVPYTTCTMYFLLKALYHVTGLVSDSWSDFNISNEHTWTKSYIHALQKGISSIGAGLNASRRGEISFLKGLYMTFGQVHVVLEFTYKYTIYTYNFGKFTGKMLLNPIIRY